MELYPKIKIAVAFHKKAPIDDYIKDKDIYVPIYSGTEEWNDPRILRDNTGINCSDLNKEINEITQIYWVGNHLTELGNPDYIGLNHYRRFLKFDVHDLKPNTIEATWFTLKQQNVFQQLTIYEARPEYARQFFSNYLLFFPQDKEVFNQYLAEHWFYACSLFIMHKDIFKEYFNFINFLVDLCYFYKKHKPQIFENRPRILSMFMERMTGFFIYKKQQQGINIHNCPIVIPESYYDYILKHIHTGEYFIFKNNQYYKVNNANYLLKDA